MKRLCSMRVFTVSLAFVASAPALAQADSVTSGAHLSRSRVRIGTPATEQPIVAPPTFAYLLAGVRMNSTGDQFTRTTVDFGPFKNMSEYAVTITLNHIGGSRHRHVTGLVTVDGADEVMMGHAEGGSINFIVPPGAGYRWQAKNEHSITASVPSAKVTLREVGLPSAINFTQPMRTGLYKGCWNLYDASEGGDPSRVVGKQYYFAVSPMSDGSNAWGGPVEKAGFGTVVAGPALPQAGPCSNPYVPPAPTPGPINGD